MTVQKVSNEPGITVQKVINEMLAGASLKNALASAGIGAQLFNKMLASDQSLARDYARAREVKADLLADETIDIADSEPDAQKARNRITARQWYASKVAPKTYGDRIDLNVSQTISVNDALNLARKRLTRDSADDAIPLVLDSKGVYSPEPTDTQSDAPIQNAPDIFD